MYMYILMSSTTIQMSIEWMHLSLLQKEFTHGDVRVELRSTCDSEAAEHGAMEQM